MDIFDCLFTFSKGVEGCSLERADDLRVFAFTILASLIGMGLAVWRSMIAAKQAKAATDQIEIANRNITLSERAADMDRFQKGAGMLSDTRLSVRQAGIIILDDLARENPARFALMCQKTLEQFISELSREGIKNKSILPNSHNFPDVIAALAAAMKISHNGGQRIFLERAHLGSIALIRHSLRNAHFREVSLIHATLSSSDLKDAKLYDVNFDHSTLNDINMEKVYSLSSSFESANLANANLRNASLIDANLQNANLENVNLKGAILTSSSLINANLRGANFKDSNVTWEQLDKALNVDKVKNLPPREKNKGE